MPCDGMQQTPQQIAADAARMKALEVALARKQVKVALDRMGRATFEGWTDRGDLHDDCTYRRLMAAGSSALRMALARSRSSSEQGRRVAQ